jgi:short-subunit dehydrogenase
MAVAIKVNHGDRHQSDDPNRRRPAMSSSNAALITGASAGIGAAYADRLARRGHNLILVACDDTRLNALAERLRAEAGRSVEILVADLSARPDLLRIEHRLREDPAIAMLVNNAGVAVSGPMHGSDVDRLEAMVDINITAALRLAHAAVASFVARTRGTLINVSSVLALAPERFNPTYTSRRCCLAPRRPNSGARRASTSRRCRRAC